ncbi:ribosomal RNA small subunit methyltransferase I [Sulfurovum sp. enrichment culture clone C5]|uniref:Ribosomal RNA small subunit methyltransferase I n=1 Tax=Sulfurovum sp. enrichment culture clone C5 TaxID=497650 RepID=A0A0S4XL60_9BACT|nr:ribosomal RNA small subunit methyltransferase I [Sulfurovum sp. enrichment culture clone C5]
MLTFIPTPIGNPADITIRAMRAFESAELFLCEDTRNTKHLLQLLSDRYGMTMPNAIFLSFNEHNGDERLSQIENDLKEKNVVYVSDAGMPVISDPGQILVVYCQENKISYDVLPGANAALTAYVASGFMGGEFVFLGFLPHRGKERKAKLEVALNQEFVSILYEAPHRLLKFLEEIAALEPDREIFLAKELTKKYQKYYKNRAGILLKEFRDENIRGEWVVIMEPKAKSDITLSLEEIVNLDLSPKEKAKLLSETTGKSPKECYSEIMNFIKLNS